jgi:endonuclease/exonuclease/phosphatase family metal-dependent hydrolase
MVRVVSYNILAGGYRLGREGGRRIEEIIKIIQSAQPDIIGLVEATNPAKTERPTVPEEIAERLGMRLVSGGQPRSGEDYQTALLTRLPIVSSKVHERPGILNKPLIEVCVEDERGEQLTAFVTHLSAAFSKGRGGGYLRMREVQEIVKIMAPLRQQQRPHFIMGDFNSLAPGDPFKAHRLLRYINHMDKLSSPKAMDGNPHMDGVVPKKLSFLKPFLRIVPGNPLLSAVFDWAAGIYAPRGCIGYVRAAGYVDCFRYKNPKDWGFTCPAGDPAGRIDYIFASPELAERLEDCYEIRIGEDGVRGDDASDHLALNCSILKRIESMKKTGCHYSPPAHAGHSTTAIPNRSSDFAQ